MLKNALHAITGDGEIQVLVKWDMFRNRVRIIVRDNGVGIEPDQLDKIFSPFFTTRTRGTGLGLALAKRLLICMMVRLRSFPIEGREQSSPWS